MARLTTRALTRPRQSASYNSDTFLDLRAVRLANPGKYHYCRRCSSWTVKCLHRPTPSSGRVRPPLRAAEKRRSVKSQPLLSQSSRMSPGRGALSTRPASRRASSSTSPSSSATSSPRARTLATAVSTSTPCKTAMLSQFGRRRACRLAYLTRKHPRCSDKHWDGSTFTPKRLAIQADAIDSLDARGPLDEFYGMPVMRYAGYYIGFLCEPQDPLLRLGLRLIATLLITTATILRQGSSTARRSKGRPTGSLPTRRQPRRAAALTPSSPTRWTATAGCAASANPSSPTARTGAPPSGSTVRPSAPSAQPCQQFGVASLTLCGVFADATSMVSLGNGSIRVVSAAGPCTHGTGYSPGGKNLPGCNTSILTYSLRKHGFMCVTKAGPGVAQKQTPLCIQRDIH